jgi:ABC-type Fe3+-hydroxamate transport system substrate-binding protein
MLSFTDQTGRTISLEKSPSRIISLVPSQTELLFDLGLDETVVGITKFCVHPDNWFRKKTRIGGTKNPDIEKINLLRPDLIIANKEENVQSDIERLSAHFPVWVSDVKNLPEAIRMIHSIGSITDKTDAAEIICRNIQANFNRLQPITEPIPAAYLIWKNPFMTVGNDTFIHDMLSRCGLKNIFESQRRYPETNLNELREKGCRLLLLSSEPYPFRDKHIKELNEQLPHTRILIVNGEFFSWYGSRLQTAPAYFERLLQRDSTKAPKDV